MIAAELRHSYSDGISGESIALIGPMPPPLGGVSVHLQRTAEKFKSQGNTVSHFNPTAEYRYRTYALYSARLAWWLLATRPQRVYYHTMYLSTSLSELALLKALKALIGYKLIIVEHDCRHMYLRPVAFKQRYNILLSYVDELILIGSVTTQSYHDAQLCLPTTTRTEGAFLPPLSVHECSIQQSYPVSLHAFVYNHSPLIIANAFQLSLINGHDLYGIDLCLQMLASVVQVHKRAGLVIALAQVGDVRYFKELYFLAHKLNLADHLYILTKQKELWPLFKYADLFVRPTMSDGASVSVHEALYFNVATIASDVCARPEGTILFHNRDLQDFTQKVLTTLQVVH